MKHAIDFFHAVENKNFFKDIPILLDEGFLEHKKTNFGLSECIAKMMFVSCDMGAWMVNIKTKDFYVTEKFAELLGYSKEDLFGLNIKKFKKSIHPEDAKTLEECLSKHLNGKNKHLSCLVRLLHKKKYWVKILIKGRVVLEDSNNNKWLFGINMTMDELADYQEELKDLANYDILTHLPNRKFLMEKLTESIKTTEKSGDSLALCFIDLDGFKSINDNYGHNVGDKFLCEVSKNLRKTVRSHDLVARLGGDEFVVVFNRIKDNHVLFLLLDRLAKACHKNITIDNNKFATSASIGVVLYPNVSGSVEELISFADKSMYQAKFTKNQKYIIFDDNQENLKDLKDEFVRSNFAFKRLLTATADWFK